MNPTTPTINIGINGFGIIGRLVYRILQQEKEIKVDKINDPIFASLRRPQDLEYLLQHDSVHRFHRARHPQASPLKASALEMTEITAEKEVEKLNWQDIDIVIDATPHLRSYPELNKHLQQGAGYVVRTSPLKGDLALMQTILPGVNLPEMDLEKYKIFSAASCTTNCLAPLVKLVMDYCRQAGQQISQQAGQQTNQALNSGALNNEVEQMDFVTVHAYTSDQLIKDGFHKADPCRGRDVYNIIGTETGASSQIVVIFPALRERIFGSCYRVPVTDGSLLELRVSTTGQLDLAKFNEYVCQQAASSLAGILRYETAPLVSSDCIDDPHSAIYLEAFTEQLQTTKVKLVALYDNEFGYANRIVDLVKEIKKRKFDPLLAQSQDYKRQMTIDTWTPGCTDCDCECKDKLSAEEVNAILRDTAKFYSWPLERIGEGRYSLTAPDFGTAYQIRYDPQENTITLYTPSGQIVDLSKEPERHAPVHAFIQDEFQKKLAEGKK